MKRRKIILKMIVLLLMFLLLTPKTNVSASSWTPSSGGIYSENANSKPPTTFEKDEPGLIEKMISPLLIGIADGVQSVLDTFNINLDAIIYGRVMGYAKTNFYSFELKPNNPYGITGAFMYSTLRSVILTLMSLTALITFIKISLGIGASNGRAKAKEQISTFLFTFALLFIMPNIIDLLLYIRDLLLYSIATAINSSSMINGKTLEIVDQYRTLAKSSKSLIDAAMYLSSVFLGVYFAFVYVFVASNMTIAFCFFPVLALISSGGSMKLISNWFKTMLSFMLVPVVDSVLLTLPLFASVLKAPSLLVFAMCMAIIPARSIVRNMLGVNGNIMGENMGLGNLLMAGALAKSAIGGAKRFGDMGKEISNINNKNRMNDELGTLEGRRTNEIENVTNIPNLSSAAASTKTKEINEKYNTQKNQIISKYATKDNFEQKQFSDVLTHDEKSRFYKEKGTDLQNQRFSSAIYGTVGAGVGLSSSMFGSGATKIMATNVGLQSGQFLGQALPIKLSSNVDNPNKYNSDVNEDNRQDSLSDNNFEIIDQSVVPISSTMHVDVNSIHNNQMENVTDINNESVSPAADINANSNQVMFGQDEYQMAIQEANKTTDTLVSNIQNIMKTFKDTTGYLPRTTEYNNELLRVNASERSKVLGDSLTSINSDADVLEECEKYFNFMRSRANLESLYSVYGE